MLLRLACALTLVIAAAPDLARAQLDDAQRAAAARSLFEEGMALARADRWQDATERFRRALALKDSPVLAYNLAVALGRLGQLVEGSELLLRVERDPEARADIQKLARAELAIMRPRIAKLEVAVHGELGRHEVVLDGRVLDAVMLGLPIPVDPGAHRLELRRGGAVVQSAECELKDGARERLELTVPSLSPEEVARRGMEADPLALHGDARPAPLWQNPFLWAGVGGAAVAAIAIALVASGGDSGGAGDPVRGNLGPGTVIVGGQP